MHKISTRVVSNSLHSKTLYQFQSQIWYGYYNCYNYYYDIIFTLLIAFETLSWAQTLEFIFPNTVSLATMCTFLQSIPWSSSHEMSRATPFQRLSFKTSFSSRTSETSGSRHLKSKHTNTLRIQPKRRRRQGNPRSLL